MRHELGSGGLRVHLVGLVVGGVLAAVIALGAVAIVAFDRAVEPELENRTLLIGSIVRSELQQALGLGIPIDAIAGLDRHLGETLQKFEEVERIAVRAASGEVLAQAERNGAEQRARQPADAVLVERMSFVLPVLSGSVLVGEIAVETNPRFIQTRLREVFLDVLVVALVAIVVALELVQVVMATTIGKPLDRTLRLLREQRDGNFLHRVRPGSIGALERVAVRFNDHATDLAERLAALPVAVWAREEGLAGLQIATGRPRLLRWSDVSDMRLALFLFSVATEVSTAFLPLYVQAAQRPDWLSAELAAAAPLLFYLLGIAAMSPFAGRLARRFGPHRLFLAAVLPTAMALVGMGFSDSVVGITLWRLLLSVCYALATIACQEYAMRAAPNHVGAGPLGGSMAAIFGGVFCGSALGGLLAERFGFTSAFVSGAAIVILAGVMGLLAMRGSAGDAVPARADTGSPAAAGDAGQRVKLFVLMFGVAVPMSATTAIVVWYLTPLLLADQGSGPAEIARVVMLYYLAVVIVGPAAGGVSDNRTGPVPPIICGGLLSGGALLVLSVWGGVCAAAGALAVLGMAHAMLRAPLYSLVLRLSGGSSAVLAMLRMVERLGAVLGLLYSAALLDSIGIDGSLRLVAGAVVSGLALYTLYELLGWRERARGR